MFPTLLVCSAIMYAEVEAPVSAIDAVEQAAVARLPEYFGEPDTETAALFAMPVAKVNGQTILAGALLERYDVYLRHVRKKISPEKYAQIVQELIQRDLPEHIVAEAIWSEMAAQYSEEMQRSARLQVDGMWVREQHLLARELAGQERRFLIRPSLDEMQKRFIHRRMIQTYLGTKFPNAAPEEFREYRDQLLRDAKIETAYVVSFDELK